jgi:hypothetical protein
MRKNSLFVAIAFTVVAGAAFAAPSPQTSQPQVPPQPPPAGTTYKPDFEISRPEGSGVPRTEALTPTEGYVIGPQDNLSIIVSDEADLTGKYRVDSDGTISMPYLSRVPLAGLSLAEAQDKITKMLKAGYLVNPQVRIEVDQFKARNVLVTGEVRQPGKVTLPGTTMSLLEALALAARLLDDACAAAGRPARSFTQAALALLGAVTWPGNLEQLRTAIERVVAGGVEDLIQIEHILPVLQLHRAHSPFVPSGNLREARQRFERDYIASVLQHHDWRMAPAAQALGIQRPNLYRKARQLGIPLVRVSE